MIMAKKDFEKRILEFLDGSMSEEEKKDFLENLNQYGYEKEEILELRELNKDIADFPVPEPSEEMSQRFHSMLEHAKYEKQFNSQGIQSLIDVLAKIFTSRIAFNPAFFVIIIPISIAFGMWISSNAIYDKKINNMSSEITQMKEVMMLTMLEQPSATERIKAVNLTNDLNEVDEKIIHALVKTLNSDPNVNVRLVTIETLYHYAENPIVREELIKSIALQDSPLIQIALADIMVALQEKKSIKEFNKLLEKKDLNDAARGKILKTIDKLI